MVEENIQSLFLALENYRDQWNILVEKRKDADIQLERVRDQIKMLSEQREKLENDNKGLISELEKRERLIVENEKELEDRKIRLEKEIESERKVSFVKNTQAQLKECQAECEILHKQVAFYRKGGEIITLLANKYNLQIDNTTNIETIESAIIKCFNIANNKETKQEINEQQSFNKEEQPVASQVKKEEEQTSESQVKKEENREEINDQTSENVVELEEEDEDVIEVVDFPYKGQLYYLDSNTGDIYSRLDDDSVGEIIGKVEGKGRVKMFKKK